MKKIVDDKPALSGSYLRLVLFRSDDVRALVGLWDWVLLTLVELIVGDELLEQLVITSAYNETGKKVGHFLHLSNIVPSGIITNALRQKIYQVLYFKYHIHYLFLAAESAGRPVVRDGDIDLRRDRFGMRHDLLYQVIAFRRVYILAWLGFNVIMNILLFLVSDLQTALLGALSIEGARRLCRL